MCISLFNDRHSSPSHLFDNLLYNEFSLFKLVPFIYINLTSEVFENILDNESEALPNDTRLNTHLRMHDTHIELVAHILNQGAQEVTEGLRGLET